MKIEELELLQAEFEEVFSLSEYEDIEKKRKSFIKKFPINKVLKLAKEKYVIGIDNTTFCYYVENELNAWGNIHGSTAHKFGIYFGKLGDDNTKQYRIGNKIFGTQIESAYQKVLQCIYELLMNSDDMEVLKKNPISPMYKGKILSLYFPEKFLNTFSLTYLKYFLRELGLEYNLNNELDLQALLVKYKNDNEIMRKWNMYKYGKFLYFALGSPKKRKKISNNLVKASLPDYPNLNDINCEVLKLEFSELIDDKALNNRNSSGKKDYEKIGKYKKRIGDIGEYIIFNFEKEKIKKLKLKKEIQHISTKDDNAGYDIKSFNENGEEKFIEVKSTSHKLGNNKIFITANELEKSKELKNYYFYFVFEILSNNPKIYEVPAKEFLDEYEKFFKPISYSFRFVKKTNPYDNE